MFRFETISPAHDGHRQGGAARLAACAETRGEFGGLAPCRTRSPDFLLSVVAECPAIERAARLRALAALAWAMVRPRPSRLLAALRRAEGDDATLREAETELDTLPSVTARRLLSAWGNCL